MLLELLINQEIDQMKQAETTVSRKNLHYAIGLVIFVILLVLAIQFPLSKFGQSQNTSIDASKLVAGSAEKFAFLSGQGAQRSVGST